MATYDIEPERATLHGHFSRDLPPAVTIDSGDTVVFRTLDANWAIEPRRSAHHADWPATFQPRDPRMDDGHALCGPVAIRGAEPGMVLEIEIGAIVPADWGWTGAGGWSHEVNRRLGLLKDGGFLLWKIDAAAGTAIDQLGHLVRLRPFMGVMGMPADVPGIQPTPPPRATGGNLDCKELVTGSRLFLPVAVPGGLFSTGDGHARQGDGESSVMAIECPMERVELTFHLHPERSLRTPRAWTTEGWITLGLHADLNEATYLALEAMLDLLQEQEPGLTRGEGLALASVLVDLRVTQIVNGVKGVHAVLPHDALRKVGA